MQKTTLVLATTNSGKSREIQSFLEGYPIEVRDLNDFGHIPEVAEDGATFEENAYKKALFTARMLGIPALADDSGLEVEALAGAPGVHSARYAGPDASDEANNRKLLESLQGQENRKARFCCVLSLAVPSGPALTYEAYCEGTILEQARGTAGFGYDPLFFYGPVGKTFGEMTLEEKSRVSHRGKALSEFRSEIDRILKWLQMRMVEEEALRGRHECHGAKG